MGRAGLMLVIFSLGCTTPKAAEKPAEPVKTEPVAEPVKAEPVVEPVKAEPVVAEPVKTEPVKTEPVKAQPVKTEPVKAEPTKVTEPDAKIARMWKSKCGSCHGADGKAATSKGKKMLMDDFSTKAWQAAHTDAQIKKAITDGLKADKGGVTQEMDAFPELSAADVTALAQHVRWLGPH